MSKIDHSRYHWKYWDVFFPTVSSLHESELGWESYGSRKQGCSSNFSLLFRWRFRPNRRCYRWTKSCSSYLRLSFFLKFLTFGPTCSKLGRLYAQRWSPEWKKVLDFQHNFLTFVDFPAHSWHSSGCLFSMILVSLVSSWCLLQSVTNLMRSRAWAWEIQPCEQRPPEWFSWKWVICQSRFRPNQKSSWPFVSCT